MSTEPSYTVTPLPVPPEAIPRGVEATCLACGRRRDEVAAMIGQAVERQWPDGRRERAVHHVCGDCEAKVAATGRGW